MANLKVGIVRARYLEHAEITFPLIAPVLSERAGVGISLRSIEEAELLATELWRQHPDCQVTWAWRELMRRFRRTAKRMDASFYCGDQLCGLMVATISRSRVNVNVMYVEAAPDPGHPLKKIFLGVAMFHAELFAASLGATHVSVSNPLPQVVDYYLRLGYERIFNDRKRLARGGTARDKLLVKAI